MGVWKVEISRIIRLATGNPESITELVTVLIIAAGACVIVLNIVGNLLKFPMINMKRSIWILAIGLLAVIVVTTAVNLYLAPHLANESLRRWLPVVAATVVLLAIIVPSACLLYNAPYFKALFSVLLSVAAAWAVMLLVQAGLSAVRGGEKVFDKTKSRTTGINELLSK